MTLNERLRQLPSVDEVLQHLETGGLPRDVVVSEARRAIENARARLRAGEAVDLAALPAEVSAAIDRLVHFSLGHVINATGVVLHTNLGRAPLRTPVGGGHNYSNLEYDLATGKRGKRDVHVARLLEALLGAAGIVVNNNAAAVFLVLQELAAGYEVIVSRGELIEIGDGFRIPDIMARSGAVLREVGTTNKTRIEDYRGAITERTRLILRVHPSNFRIEGFTASPSLEELCSLGRERGIPVYEDLGSGCLVDLRSYGIDEPLARDSIRAGVDLLSFSGDKLLGGPQAGIIAGRADLVARVRRNPLFRALRVDKLIYSALEKTLWATLFEEWQHIPALAMIMMQPGRIRERADRVAAAVSGEVVEGRSVIGGGSTPAQSLPTWLVAVRGNVAEIEKKLRAGNPPVIARIEDDRLLFDLRTVFEDEEADLVAAIGQARSR